MPSGSWTPGQILRSFSVTSWHGFVWYILEASASVWLQPFLVKLAQMFFCLCSIYFKSLSVKLLSGSSSNTLFFEQKSDFFSCYFYSAERRDLYENSTYAHEAPCFNCFSNSKFGTKCDKVIVTNGTDPSGTVSSTKASVTSLVIGQLAVLWIWRTLFDLPQGFA